MWIRSAVVCFLMLIPLLVLGSVMAHPGYLEFAAGAVSIGLFGWVLYWREWWNQRG